MCSLAVRYGCRLIEFGKASITANDVLVWGLSFAAVKARIGGFRGANAYRKDRRGGTGP
ncbi:MAG: hypothetical protein JO166_11940 [Deltaproteobacteria bacterium]|nr:hypothetical protein [Deltaproteobacteria bacterium]